MAESNAALEYQEKFGEVREKLQAVLKDVGKDTYYEADAKRVNEDNVYLNQFIRHQGGDVAKAVDMIKDALLWRKTFGVRDITESSVPVELWQKGSMYFHNQDIDEHQILWLVIAARRKGEFSSEVQKMFVYLLEQANQKAPGKQVTVVLDFTGAGLTSVDIEFTKFMINCFKYYFPSFLNIQLNYEMPWLFNAAWKIIKAFLDENAIKKIKFEGQKTIQNYIKADQLPSHMGGTDEFKYVYEATK